MKVWIMIIWMSGQGQAVTTLPFEYSSAEECVAAGENMQGSHFNWKPDENFVCVEGPRFR